MSVMAQIRAHMSALTPAERTFAEYVLNKSDIIYKSITLATEDSKTGYGTIIRFCQKLGYSGFQDFKIHLALEEGSRRMAEGQQTDTLALAAEQVARQLTTTVAGVSQDTVERVALRLSRARRVLAIGVAGSYPAALELTYRLSRMSIVAEAEADGHMQAIRASALDSESALVAVSFSGSTKDILDAVRQAKDRGAYVAALTNYRRSPLVDMADDVLCTAIWEEALQAEVGTRLPFLFLLEIVCATIYRKYPMAREAVVRTSTSVASKQM